MQSHQFIQSVASLGARAGTVAANHMHPAFSALMKRPNTHDDPSFLRLVTGLPHPITNFVILTNTLDAQAATRAIEPLLQNTFPSAIFFLSNPSAEVAACIQASGFVMQPSLPAMAIDIDALKPTSLSPGLQFKRIEAREADSWADAMTRGYELPPGFEGEIRPTAQNTNVANNTALQYFAILRGGVIIATSTLYLHDGVAGIYCVATISEERKKGLGAHLTAEPLRLAHGLGYRVGVLQASAAGEPVYKKLGFTTYAEMPLFVRIPA